MALKPFTSFILGILTVLIIITGIYLFIDFTRTEKRVADYSVNDNPDGETYIYDKDDVVLEEALDESITKNLNNTTSQKGTIAGMLCYPAEFLPKGEVVAKNTSTNQSIVIEVDGQSENYEIEVDPGTYNLRYQAHASGTNEYTSGYHTKCALESSAEICDSEDGHDLIPVTISTGETIGGINLCDFYYQKEPEF